MFWIMSHVNSYNKNSIIHLVNVLNTSEQHSKGYIFMNKFIKSFIHSSIQSFNLFCNQCIYSFIHPFIYSSIYQQFCHNCFPDGLQLTLRKNTSARDRPHIPKVQEYLTHKTLQSLITMQLHCFMALTRLPRDSGMLCPSGTAAS